MKSDTPTPDHIATVYMNTLSLKSDPASWWAHTEIKRLRAELAAAIKQRDEALQAKSWQPIETAPRDGTYVLLWDDVNECVYSACWVEDPGMNSPNGYEPASSYWSTDHLGWGNDGSNPRWWMPHPEDPPLTQEEPDNMNEEEEQ